MQTTNDSPSRDRFFLFYLSKRSLFLFLFISTIHLLILTIYYGGLDWLLFWRASVEITNGISYYDQNPRYLVEYQAVHSIPFHFPLFFYILALIITIFGTVEFFGRIFLWICTNLLILAIFLIVDPKTDREFQLTSILFFVNPILGGINFLGLFDQFACLLMVTGILLLLHEHPTMAGIALGLGVMTKFFPIFAVVTGSIYLLKKKKIIQLLQLLLSSSLVSLSIFMYFFLQSGSRFLNHTFGYHFRVIPNEITFNLSIWTFILPKDLPTDKFFPIQLFIFLASLIYIIFFCNMENESHELLLSTSLIISIFIIILRRVHGHYGFWIIVLLIPNIIIFYREKNLKSFFAGIFLIITFYVAVFISYITPFINLLVYEAHFVGAIIICLVFVCQFIFIHMNTKRKALEQ